jgi:hypothetical protein
MEAIPLVRLRPLFHLSCLVFFLSGLLLNAQEYRGTILGRITDPSGAVISGAAITAVGPQQTYSAKSGANGDYIIPFVQPGTYAVTAEAQNFKKTVQTGIVIDVSQKINLNFTLEIGPVAETISVQADNGVGLNTADASGGTVMDPEKVQNLPLNGRQLYMMLNLTPGTKFTQTQFGPGGYSGTRGWDESNASTDGGLTPTDYFRSGNPYPNGYTLPPGNSQGLATGVGSGYSFDQRNRKIPISQQYSFGFQGAAPLQMVWDLEFVGTHTTKLRAPTQLNGLNPSDFYKGHNNHSYLDQQVSNPFYDVVPATTGLGQNPTIQAKMLMVPFPQFDGSVYDYTVPQGYSNYNSLIAKLEKRFTDSGVLGRGLSFLASFTWSKTMSAQNRLNNSGAGLVDPAPYYAVSSNDPARGTSPSVDSMACPLAVAAQLEAMSTGSSTASSATGSLTGSSPMMETLRPVIPTAISTIAMATIASRRRIRVGRVT